MPDDKEGREKQAHNAERRQRERELLEELERSEETEPPADESALSTVEEGLSTVSFPATGTAVVEAVGDHTVETDEGAYSVADLVPETEDTFEEPAAVRLRVQRPTIAASMKRIVEAGREHTREGPTGSQRTAYEKTLRALAAIDADDDDEGVTVITDWIVERTQEKGSLPGSRAVRREAAQFCRGHGYEVSNNDWLGV